MSVIPEAEIEARRQDLWDRLDELNPGHVEMLSEIMEDMMSTVIEQICDNPDYFYELKTDGLQEEDLEIMWEWESEMIDQAIQRWHTKLAYRAIETAEPMQVESEKN